MSYPHTEDDSFDRLKAIIERLVNEVMNSRHLDVLEKLCAPQLAPKLRTAFSTFTDALPDWHQELVELVARPDVGP